MKIFNVMFSKKQGGLEQAFLDYADALNMQGNQVISIIHPKCQIKSLLKTSYIAVHNFNKYDLLAIHRLSKIIAKEKPNCIIAHGARASILLHKTKTEVPIITVSHNNERLQTGRDATIAITSTMRDNIIKTGQDKDKVYLLHNMIHFEDNSAYRRTILHNPIKIGICGRLVSSKGFDLFIEALSILKQQGLKFEALIGGDGPEKENLEELVQKLQLQDSVNFIGWFNNKEDFYKNLDIIVIPSRVEAFGLVNIEAMKYSLPIVASKSEGALEILTDRYDALLVDVGSSNQIADSINEIISNETLRNSITQNAFSGSQKYSIFDASRTLQRIIEEVCFKRFY